MHRTNPRRTRSTMATTVAFLALFVTLGSGSYAAGVLTGKDVKNGSLTGKDLKDESVTGKDIKNLTGLDLDEETLDVVPSAEIAGTAQNALTAETAKTAETIGQIKASDLLTTYGCQTGKVLGFARVKGQNGAAMPNTFTTSSNYVDASFNCSGSSVVVRRLSAGHYRVKFTGNPAFLAFAQVRTDADNGDADVCATLNKVTVAGPDQNSFDVVTTTCDGADFHDTDFTLLLP